MFKNKRMSRYILNEVETRHHLILIRLYFMLTILIAVSCLLRVRSVSFTSRAKGCIKIVHHSCLVSLSHKIGVFLEEAICYFIYDFCLVFPQEIVFVKIGFISFCIIPFRFVSVNFVSIYFVSSR
jgi:uncharacterized membrane protein YesL